MKGGGGGGYFWPCCCLKRAANRHNSGGSYLDCLINILSSIILYIFLWLARHFLSLSLSVFWSRLRSVVSSVGVFRSKLLYSAEEGKNLSLDPDDWLFCPLLILFPVVYQPTDAVWRNNNSLCQYVVTALFIFALLFQHCLFGPCTRSKVKRTSGSVNISNSSLACDTTSMSSSGKAKGNANRERGLKLL